MREPTGVTGLMLVGSVSGKVAVLIDDLADVLPPTASIDLRLLEH
jgi:phosphoribosylpyrophosphate synthetase